MLDYGYCNAKNFNRNYKKLDGLNNVTIVLCYGNAVYSIKS